MESHSISRVSLFDIIENKVQCFFDKVCSELNISSISIKRILKIENSSIDKGDLSLFLSPLDFPSAHWDLNDIAERMKTELQDYFSDCIALHNSRLNLILNKANAYRYCLKQVLNLKGTYGSQGDTKKTVLILAHNDTLTDLTDFRTALLAEHIASILLMNGCKIYCDKRLSVNSNSFAVDNLRYFDCGECCAEESYVDFEKKIENSEWLLKGDSLPQNIKVKHSDEDVTVIDGRRYLMEAADSGNDYKKIIGYVYMKKGTSYTDCFKQSAMIEHVLDKHVVDADIILHVVPLKKHHSILQSGLVIDMLRKGKPKNLYLVLQLAVAKNQQNAEIGTFTESRLGNMQQALVHKYGEDILMDESWLSVIKTLVDTVIKFNFLFTRFSVPLKIDYYDSATRIRDKGGSFAQYNCARLTNIFNCFDQKVAKGTYTPLPDIDSVDFSHLQLTEEWSLFFNYILPFPKIIADLANGIKNLQTVQVSVPSHRICQLLVSLSHDFSIYYNKHRVLTEPSPPLLKKMYPRLYLLQAIHQIMRISLALLNLPTVEKM